MSHSDGGVTSLAFRDEEQGHRFPNDEAAADNDDFGAGCLDTCCDEKALATERRAGDERRGILHGELGHVHRMETVDILAGVNGHGYGMLVDVLRRG